MKKINPGPILTVESRGVYTVEAARTLPTINATKTIKSVWLSSSVLQRYNMLEEQFRTVFLLLWGIAVVVSFVGALVMAPIARGLAPLIIPLTSPLLVSMLLSLRYDMVILLLGTFEFWYRFLAVGVGVVMLGIHFGDSRAQTQVSVGFGNLVLLLVDSNYRGMKSQVGMLLGSAIVMLLISTAIAFSLFDDVHDFTVFHIYDHTITARSIITNSFALSCLLFLHNAYSRRSYAKRSPSSVLTTTNQCVLYRCRLRWQPVLHQARLAIVRRDVARPFDEDKLQLRCRCHGLRQAFNARNVLVEASEKQLFTPYTNLQQLLLLANGVTGFVTMISTFAAVALGHNPASTTIRTLSAISFIFTVSVNGFFIGFVYQVDMLRLLYTSFDFVFNFSQLAVAQIYLCDLSSWDVRVYAIISSLLWMHWASTIDAIPPIKRQQLGLNVRRVSALIQISFLAAMALFSVDLLTWHSQGFVNRDVLHDIGYRKSLSDSSGDQRTANWSVGSFFLNRILGLALWICRSVYHIATYEEDELVSLRGRVEFDDYEAAKRQQRRVSSMTKVGAIIQALSDRSQRQASEDRLDAG